MKKSQYSAEIAKQLRDERIETCQGFCYKNMDFNWEDGDDDEIIYVPEYGFVDFIEKGGERQGIIPDIGSCYTKKDFIELAGKQGKELFEEVDWQYPETLYNEWDEEDFEEN